MKRGIDPESFGFLVNDVARLVRTEMDRRIAASGLGLTPGEARVLAYAARFEPVRQSVLAERAALEPMTVSTYLDTLEARGLIERQTDPADRRAKLVTLTAAAPAVLDGIGAIAADIRALAAVPIGQERWDELKALLVAVRDGLQGGAGSDSD